MVCNYILTFLALVAGYDLVTSLSPLEVTKDIAHVSHDTLQSTRNNANTSQPTTDSAYVEEVHQNLGNMGNNITPFEKQIKSFVLETEKRIQLMEHSIEYLKTSNSYLQKRLSDVERKNEELRVQLSLSQQQLLGLQSMITFSKLWVITPDQFIIGKEIGRGAWATVHKATYRGATVAAKKLHDIIHSIETKKMFQHEMDITLSCQHQNVVTFLGATSEDPLVLLMELMDFNMKDAYTKHAAITHTQAHKILHEIAMALHFLHTRPDPVIHRDVSSANVLLKVLYNGEWLAKLGDLGTAKIQQQTKSPLPGTIAYAASEASEPKKHSTKMDVHSFGILIIEALTSSFPYIEIVDTLKDQVQKKYPQYYHLVTSCTKQQLSDRPTMYDVLVQLDGIGASK